ncbi:hypothetical protein PFMC_04057 [Plasmodium falciparum CAMP/Malaysia]|uniref:Uncharacterized protein n=1 Tax=Plasmodium falciparum (isolate Camp / Malaysia) TaxID=5835 RepID=A0A024X4E6_PLAFC|nr:hypothetical protein PFMC_04057 [Plasmodium falciparum CAMP/Malaysia]
MFHLIVYSDESLQKVKRSLNVFENIYDQNGNKFEKSVEQNIKKCMDLDVPKYIHKLIDDENKDYKEYINEDIYNFYLRKDIIQFFTCNLIQLYIKDTKNCDLYLIDECEEEKKEKEKKESKCKDDKQKYKNTQNLFKKEKHALDENNVLSSSNNTDDISVGINLPLHRSHILLILSLPTYYTFYEFFLLIQGL